MTEKVARLGNRLGPRDRAKISEYLDSVRDVERRIQKAEEQVDRELPVVDRPAGVPGSFEEHAKLMTDLITLAYQTDLTRVSSFMYGRETSVRTFPEIGIPDPWHPLSHHQNNPVQLEKFAKLNAYHVNMFAYALNRLQSTADGDGSLLDHTVLLYSSGMSNSDLHIPENLPTLIAGGQIKGGRHLRYPKGTPLVNLQLTLLDRLGVRVDQFGDSTGELNLLSEI